MCLRLVRGLLFDPERYPFLEGRLADEPVTTVPSIPDESLAEVLGLLTLVGGPYEKAFAFDYAVFDPHDFGTAFETLMGYSVIRLKSDAVRIEGEAMSAALGSMQLLSRRAPWPEPTPAERWAAFVQDQRERTEHWSPATWARWWLRMRRNRVRYGCKRLRAGTENWRRQPLSVVRAETVAALLELGHASLGSMVLGDQVDANALRRVRRANVRALIRRRRRGVGRPSDVAQLTRWLAALGHSALPSAEPWRRAGRGGSQQQAGVSRAIRN